MMNGDGTPGGFGPPGSMHSASAGGDPREAVNIPSILLMIVGGLGVLFALWGLAVPQRPEQFEPLFSANPDMEQYRELIEKVANGVGRLLNLIPMVVSGLVIFGAVKMRNLENRSLAVAASIAAMVPCFGPGCCTCLPTGIAAGIYALTVLNKPEVKAAFRS